MSEFILKAHSGWAYITLIVLIIAVVNALIGSSAKNPFTPKDRRISLFALIATHIQFVLGLALYFTSNKGLKAIQALGMGGMNAGQRLLAVEHPAVNLLAVIMITVGWSRHKRIADEKKFKSIAVFYAIGLVLLLSRIPWQLWFD